MLRLFFCTVIMIIACSRTHAQEAKDSAKVMQLLGTLAKSYKEAGCLSYDIEYKYSNESKPAQVLDSSVGKVEIDSVGYWYTLDSTEMMMNATYCLTIFREDKIIYLSKAPVERNISPVDILGKSLQKAGKIIYKEQSGKKFKNIQISFPEAENCKQLDYKIDLKTGFITSMTYIVPTSQLISEDVRSTFDSEKSGYDKYARVEVTFSNYQSLTTKSTHLDETAFITKKGNDFVPNDQFKEYKIFIASPNL